MCLGQFFVSITTFSHCNSANGIGQCLKPRNLIPSLLQIVKKADFRCIQGSVVNVKIIDVSTEGVGLITVLMQSDCHKIDPFNIREKSTRGTRPVWRGNAAGNTAIHPKSRLILIYHQCHMSPLRRSAGEVNIGVKLRYFYPIIYRGQLDRAGIPAKFYSKMSLVFIDIGCTENGTVSTPGRLNPKRNCSLTQSFKLRNVRRNFQVAIRSIYSNRATVTFS